MIISCYILNYKLKLGTMAEIFSGKEFAFKKEEELLEKVAFTRKDGTVPKLVSIIIGDDPASVLYVNLKKRAAERIGCVVEIKQFDEHVGKNEVIDFIKSKNEDEKVHGVMIQLPLPSGFNKNDREELIQTISPEKDVDGLQENSKFTPPTAKAVIQIFSVGEEYLQIKDYPASIVVVGASGFIGSQITRAIEDRHWNSFRLSELDGKSGDIKQVIKNADVLISATGEPGLIKSDMVKSGSVLIDVGAPKGDVEKDAYEKASFVSPVPGGVGPVTISCLLENLVEAASI